MLISRLILIVGSMSMHFSAKQYNIVVNNDLDLIEDLQLFKEIDLSD